MSQKIAKVSARALDQFYTKPHIAKACIAFAQEQLDFTGFEAVIEPSAGAGAFSDQLGPNCVAMDVDPKAEGISKADFFDWSSKKTQRSLVIGNPPFGRNASLAVRFFNHAAQFAEAVAFIVPRSFEKASIQARLNSEFHLKAQMDVANNAFCFLGETRDVPTVFQIWERRPDLRARIKPPTTHADFVFCQREEADFAIQRVGANAGLIKPKAKAGSASSHHFLKANGCSQRLLQRFELLDFEGARTKTAGNPSIAKTEVVSLYSQAQRDSCVTSVKSP